MRRAGRLSLIVASAAAALFAATSANAATLVAQYNFNGNFASSVGGAPNLVPTDPLGTSSFVATGGWNFNGANDPASSQAGLTFDSTGLLTHDSYSIDLVFQFNDRNGLWRRIIDVENRQSDDGFYVDPSNNLDIFPVAGSSDAFSTGNKHNVLLTVDGTTVTAYLDGNLEFTATTNLMDIANPNNPGNLVNLFLDNDVGGFQDEWSSGTIYQASFYDGVAAVPEPSTWAMLLLGFAGLGYMGFRQRNRTIAA